MAAGAGGPYSDLKTDATNEASYLLSVKEEINDICPPYAEEVSGGFGEYQIAPTHAWRWQHRHWYPRLPTSPGIPSPEVDPDQTYPEELVYPYPYSLDNSSDSSESGRSVYEHQSPTFTQPPVEPPGRGPETDVGQQALAPTKHAVSTRFGPLTLGADITLAEAESRLRRVHDFPSGVPLALSSISDPPPPSMRQDTLVQIAIWSSPQKRLLASDIYASIEANFRSYPEGADQPWRRSVRHMLSFKRAFVKSRDKDHSGRHYWELDFDHLDNGYKRERRRGSSSNTKNQMKKVGGTPVNLCWGDFLEDGIFLKEESASPSASCMYPDTQVDSPSIVPSSNGRTLRNRGGRSRHNPLQRRAPISRQQSAPTAGYSPTLSKSSPIYLYPVGHPSLTPPFTTTGRSGTTGGPPSFHTFRNPRDVGSSELVPQV